MAAIGSKAHEQALKDGELPLATKVRLAVLTRCRPAVVFRPLVSSDYPAPPPPGGWGRVPFGQRLNEMLFPP